MGIIVFDLLIAHPAYADPYSWSDAQNMLYFSLGRLSFCLALLMTIVPMLVGQWNMGLGVASSSNFRMIAKSVFIIALIHPVVIGLLYNSG